MRVLLLTILAFEFANAASRFFRTLSVRRFGTFPPREKSAMFFFPTCMKWKEVENEFFTTLISLHDRHVVCDEAIQTNLKDIKTAKKEKSRKIESLHLSQHAIAAVETETRNKRSIHYEKIRLLEGVAQYLTRSSLFVVPFDPCGLNVSFDIESTDNQDEPNVDAYKMLQRRKTAIDWAYYDLQNYGLLNVSKNNEALLQKVTHQILSLGMSIY